MADFPGRSGGQAPMVLLSRKGQTRYRDQFTPPRLQAKTTHQTPVGPSSLQPNEPVKPLTSSVILIKDDMEIVDFIWDHLCKENQTYTVLGAIGVQGTGKSTLLSMLAGNQTLDKFRQYVFRPCSRDTIYSGLFQTNGLHVYVSNSVIYIDCKAFNCSAIFQNFEEQIRKTKSDANLLVYKNAQIEGLTLLGMMFELCDTLLFNIDWFIDVNAVQEVLRAALYSEFNFRKYSGYPKTTNLVVVHQRAKSQDFEMFMVKKRARMIRSMFKDSGYNVCGGVSMANLGFTEYADCEPDVNYVLIDDLPQWQKDATTETKLLNITYDAVLKRLRPALQSLEKHRFRDLTKLRPARRRGRGSKLSLPPTLDSKRAAQLKAEQLANETSKRLGEDQDRNNGNMHGDDDRARDFVPEHMPNITRWKDLPPEPWNDQQLGLSALSPPESQEEAFKSLELLLATHSRRNDYVDSLLPSVNQPRHSERQWFEYATKVLDITKKAFSTKYFISNNGRLAPRLVRKLREATKVTYTESKSTTVSKRASRRKNPAAKAVVGERPAKNEEQLVDKLNEVNIASKAENESVDTVVDENVEEEDLKEMDQEELMSEENSTDFDDDSSDEPQSASESSSSDENPKEKGARRTTRRRQRMSSSDDE